MSSFFIFLEAHRVGVLLTLLSVIVLMGIVQWGLWLFGKGRFAGEGYAASRDSSTVTWWRQLSSRW
jgi:hypothetical protein